MFGKESIGFRAIDIIFAAVAFVPHADLYDLTAESFLDCNVTCPSLLLQPVPPGFAA